MNSVLFTAYFRLHLAVLLYGFTAIFGALILLDAVALVWWRMLITTISLWFWTLSDRRSIRIPLRSIGQLVGSGLLLTAHWLTFYGAIRWGGATLTLVIFSTCSLFVAILDPLFRRKMPLGIELISGSISVLGIGLIFQADFQQAWAIGLALISTLFSALSSITLKPLVGKYDARVVNFYNIGGSWVILTGMLPAYFSVQAVTDFLPTPADWAYLLLLSIICTVCAYHLGVLALRHVSAFNYMLAVNLEPVYGVILAYFILNEKLDNGFTFWLGTFLVFSVVWLHPLLVWGLDRSKKSTRKRSVVTDTELPASALSVSNYKHTH
jgi:drug/metabolite transporter (DMT)-like permease